MSPERKLQQSKTNLRLERHKQERFQVTPTFDGVMAYAIEGQNLGRDFLEAGELSLALETFQWSLKRIELSGKIFSRLDPEGMHLATNRFIQGSLLVHCGIVYLLDSDYTKLKQVSSEAIRHLTTTIDIYKKILSRPDIKEDWKDYLYENIAYAYLQRGLAFSQSGYVLFDTKNRSIPLLEKARIDFKSAGAYRPTDENALFFDAEVDKQLALKHYFDGNYSIAQKYFATAIQKTQNLRKTYAIYGLQGTAHSFLSFMETNEKSVHQELRQAIRAFSAAIKLNPRMPDILWLRADAYAVIHEARLAAEDFGHAVELVPDRFDYRISFAQQLVKIGHHQHALKHYEYILQQIGYNAGIWEEVVAITTKINDAKRGRVKYYKQLEAMGKKDPDIRKYLSLKRLPERPTRKDFRAMLEDEIKKGIIEHFDIAINPNVKPPPTYIHRWGRFFIAVGTNFVPGGPVVGAVAGASADKAFGYVANKIDRWNKEKSKNIFKALRGNSKPAFIAELCKELTAEYGPTVEYLQLNSIGLMSLVAAMVQRMFTELGNDQELALRLERKEVDAKEVFQYCLKHGKANYLVTDRHEAKYEADKIIRGTNN